MLLSVSGGRWKSNRDVDDCLLLVMFLFLNTFLWDSFYGTAKLCTSSQREIVIRILGHVFSKNIATACACAYVPIIASTISNRPLFSSQSSAKKNTTGSTPLPKYVMEPKHASGNVSRGRFLSISISGQCADFSVANRIFIITRLEFVLFYSDGPFTTPYSLRENCSGVHAGEVGEHRFTRYYENNFRPHMAHWRRVWLHIALAIQSVLVSFYTVFLSVPIYTYLICK